MDQQTAITHLLDLLATEPRTPAEEWLQQGFGKWLRDGDTLGAFRCLSLPASPAAARRELRNRHLRRAALLIEAKTQWRRAGKLLAAVQKFDGHRWLIWRRLSSAPPHATALEAALFDAFKADPAKPMPGTKRGIYNILPDECEAETPGDFTNATAE